MSGTVHFSGSVSLYIRHTLRTFINCRYNVAQSTHAQNGARRVLSATPIVRHRTMSCYVNHSSGTQFLQAYIAYYMLYYVLHIARFSTTQLYTQLRFMFKPRPSTNKFKFPNIPLSDQAASVYPIIPLWQFPRQIGCPFLGLMQKQSSSESTAVETIKKHIVMMITFSVSIVVLLC